MARKRTTHLLPELAEYLSLGPKEYRTERLLEVLRNLALEARLYSMTEVITRLKVPVSTVARVYHGLERDRILSLIRSSKTNLRGLKYDSQFPELKCPCEGQKLAAS